MLEPLPSWEKLARSICLFDWLLYCYWKITTVFWHLQNPFFSGILPCRAWFGRRYTICGPGGRRLWRDKSWQVFVTRVTVIMLTLSLLLSTAFFTNGFGDSLYILSTSSGCKLTVVITKMPQPSTLPVTLRINGEQYLTVFTAANESHSLHTQLFSYPHRYHRNRY